MNADRQNDQLFKTLPSESDSSFHANPRPKDMTSVRKSTDRIVRNRLGQQRETLAKSFGEMAETVGKQPVFNGRVVVYATMFNDSLAPSHIPNDLFRPANGARFMVRHRMGYLIEVESCQLEKFADQVRQTTRAKKKMDISRVQSVGFFGMENVLGEKKPGILWHIAPETEDNRIFIVWFMPLQNIEAKEHLVRNVTELRDRGIISSQPPILERILRVFNNNVQDVRDVKDIQDIPEDMHQDLRTTTSKEDKISLAMRDYLERGHVRTTVSIPSRAALRRLLASGTVLRIDPLSLTAASAPEDRIELGDRIGLKD